MTINGRQVRRRFLVLATVFGGGALAAAGPASAATFQVSGVQSAPVSAGPCLDPNVVVSQVMTGELVGCWYTDALVIHPAQPNGTPSGTIQATGTEHFVGCLDLDADGSCTGDPSGTLAFRFQFSGKYGTVFPYAEIFGRCQHPVTSATGDFAGANGVITFQDDVANGTSFYTGHVAF